MFELSTCSQENSDSESLRFFGYTGAFSGSIHSTATSERLRETPAHTRYTLTCHVSHNKVGGITGRRITVFNQTVSKQGCKTVVTKFLFLSSTGDLKIQHVH